MIEFIRLKDFQSHTDTTLKLTPGFNIISGPSGNGKSAIIRALECVAFNSVGTAEVRWPDATTYHIEVGVDGHVVSRDKGEKSNQYQIDDADPFIDVNRDVPADVTKLLNLRETPLEANTDIKIQFADQLDAPFMLAAKDSLKMKFLNVLSGTNAVDLAAKKAVAVGKEEAKAAKEAKQQILALQVTVDGLENKLETLTKANKYIQEQLEELKQLDEMKGPLQALQKQADYLFEAYRHIRLIEQECSKIQPEKILNKIDQYEKFYTLRERYNQLKNKQTLLRQKREQLQNVPAEALLDKINKLVTYKSLYNQFNSWKTKEQQLRATQEELAAQLKDLATQYADVLKTQKSCPICGNSLDQHTIDTIVSEI